LTGSDKQKCLDTIFDILDMNNDGYLSMTELEKVCIATQKENENGKQQAQRIMKKIDIKNAGRVSKGDFVSAMLNDTEFETFRKNLLPDEEYRNMPFLTKAGETNYVSLGDLLKD